MGRKRIGAPAPPVRRSTRLGIRVALLGAVLQVVGFGWDAYLHHRDPQLAATEGIFTLANPSHLLIGLGLAACAGGSLIALIGSRIKATGTRARFRSVLVALAIIGFTLATAGVALAMVRGGADGHRGHDHRKTAVAGDDNTGDHGHAGNDDALVARLVGIMHQHGTAAALSELEAVVTSTPEVLNRTHHIVHELGRRSFDHYGSSRDAFANCTPAYEWGCYHGVLEGFLDAQPAVDDSTIQNACPSTVDPNNVNVLFQCLHGLGHGVVLHLDGDVSGGLSLCDALGDPWQQTSCYSGVFMENLVEGQSAAAEGRTLEGSGLLLDARDPLYPCSALERRYLAPCYEMAASVVLWFNGHDFAEAGSTCDGASRRYISICYQGLGREAFGASLSDPRAAVPRCAETSDGTRARDCYVGVVKNVINADTDGERAFDVCAAIPSRHRVACFAAVGQALIPLVSGSAEADQLCAAAPREHRAACASGVAAVEAPDRAEQGVAKR